MVTYIRKTPKGNTAKPTGITAKPSGDHMTPGTPATGQPAVSKTAVGELGAQKKRGKTNVSALNEIKAITVYQVITLIHILSTDMKIHVLKIFSATKPASVSWGKPPRGEPGEPRPTGLRTQSSQQGGATNVEYNPRVGNHNRGI